MPTYKVKVKWGRELFPDVEVNTDDEPILFKAQLFALTGVHPERQKVMCKGGILKDDEWNLTLKDGATVLLLGSKEEVPQEPIAPIKFLEDMNEAEMATALELPAGLNNLGNTCYMNATVQCLRAIPELREALEKFRGDSDAGSLPSMLTSSMKVVFKQMERGAAVTPILLLQTLHRAFPQFSQMGENGTYRQQDANECWSELLKMLQQKLPAKKSDGESSETSQPQEHQRQYNSFIEQFMGGTFEVKMESPEATEEQPKISKENFLQLSCFISPEVKYMQSGLKSKMKETLVKRSESLGRDANYTRTYLISRLPAYLTIQFVRFQYKGKEGINAKVLKDIKFPMEFDAFELCTPELQNKLCPMREKFKQAEDKLLEIKAKANEPGVRDERKNDPSKAAETKVEMNQYWFDDDLGSNNSGYYSLQAVLTHKGRSSSSGHYVAWVKHNDETWFKFDDDVVSSVTTEEILRLSGGGDWHCAYVLLYGPKLLPKTIEAKETN